MKLKKTSEIRSRLRLLDPNIIECKIKRIEETELKGLVDDLFLLLYFAVLEDQIIFLAACSSKGIIYNWNNISHQLHVCSYPSAANIYLPSLQWCHIRRSNQSEWEYELENSTQSFCFCPCIIQSLTCNST